MTCSQYGKAAIVFHQAREESEKRQKQIRERAKDPVRAPEFPVFESYARNKDEPAEEGECWSDEDGLLEGKGDQEMKANDQKCVSSGSSHQQLVEGWSSDDEGDLDKDLLLSSSPPGPASSSPTKPSTSIQDDQPKLEEDLEVISSPE